MKIPHKIKLLSLLLLFIAASIPATSAHSANLFIDPASPLVQVGGEITLCVNNPSGDVKWSSIEGEIEKTGTSVKYKAPDYVAIDAVTAKDSAGNVGTVIVVVQEKAKIDERFLKENANWEVFTSRKLILSLLLSDDGKTLWSGTSGGLEKRDAVTGEIIQVLTSLDGLPSNWIRSLLSDGSGGLWIGIDGGGVAHFRSDGTWKVFNTYNSKLPSNYFRSFLSDGSGGLWIETGIFTGSSWLSCGLDHLKPDGTWEVSNKDTGLPDNLVLSLLSDGSGGLWLGTWGGGLARLKSDGTSEVFNTDNSGLPDNYVECLLSDGNGGLWIGTDKGGLAHKKSDGIWEVFNTENSELPDNYVPSFLSDGSSGLWIGTSGGLAHKKSDGTWEMFNRNNSELQSNNILSLLSDGSGGLWIGTNNNGLAHKKPDGKWDIFKTDNSGLQDTWVSSLLSDGKDGLWIGTQWGGLAHKKSDGTWELFNSSNSKLPNNWVLSLLSDGSAGLWIGTDKGGFSHFKADGTWNTWTLSNTSSGNFINVISLLPDGNGGAWIGMDGGDLAHLKSDDTWEMFSTHNLPDNHLLSMLSDGSGGLWIGTATGGLVHFKSDGTFGEVFNKENSNLPINEVRSLLSDGNGGLWIGTYGGGIAHFKSNGTLSTWSVFNKDNSGLPSNYIQSLLSDGMGGLWIGTYYGGVAHLKSDGTWEIFNIDNSGLSENWIISLLSDGNGGVWIGTRNEGLSHLTFSSGQIQEEQYLKNGRAAIIIAGGGNTDDNALWDSTAKISNYAYKMLNKRGFFNTDIHYISPMDWADFNGDGINDKIVDSPNPARQIQLSDIQAAFDWAKTKGTLNQPLYIFFTDHGGKEHLQLARGVYIEASELKTMLDDYQKTTGNKVVFVIDACHSGTMVKALAGENRAIISSTDTGLAYFDRTEDQSFTYFVINGLFKGMNFVEAFHDAASKQKKLLGRLSDYQKVSAGTSYNFAQEPQFDDTGDGVYNIAVDGDWLKKVSVNGTWTKADVTLAIEPVTQSGVVSTSGSGGGSSGAVPLKAKAALASGVVRRVWAVIRPPQMDILVDSTGIPLLAFPKVDLSLPKNSSNAEAETADSDNPNSEEQNIYKGSWNGFVYNGEYEITFYAEDNEGNIESSESIKLTVGDGMACPERASLKVSATGNSINDSAGNTDNIGKIVYTSGDTLKISITENLAYGYDLYVALFMPDGNFVALKSPLKDSNQLQKENFNKLYWGDRWIDTSRNTNMGKVVDVVDILLSEEILSQNTAYQGKLPLGSYCVYAALIPQGEDLLNAAGKGLFVLDGVCFEVVK
ncbi:MAG: hypothetical protein HQK70_10700 [Desulfamplus sp.]|nr:hypothetical protein [Desulfamplus sp.]